VSPLARKPGTQFKPSHLLSMQSRPNRGAIFLLGQQVPHDHRQLLRDCDSRDVLTSSSGDPPKECPQRPWTAIRLPGSLYQHASGM
jgi:hypothetical protein